MTVSSERRYVVEEHTTRISGQFSSTESTSALLPFDRDECAAWGVA